MANAKTPSGTASAQAAAPQEVTQGAAVVKPAAAYCLPDWASWKNLVRATLALALFFTVPVILHHWKSNTATPTQDNASPTEVASPSQSADTCPEFSTEHHSCAFGDVIKWASTGTVPPGAKPKALCFDRLPTEGDYSLFNANGADGVGDGKGKVEQASKGFQAPKGTTRMVTYWLADSKEDCAKT